MRLNNGLEIVYIVKAWIVGAVYSYLLLVHLHLEIISFDFWFMFIGGIALFHINEYMKAKRHENKNN